MLTPTEVRRLLDAHGLAPSRALGQNFVADPNTVRRVARLADIGPGDRVIEIGAGLGSLTLALAETGASVTAVEIDRHVLPVLREVVEPTGARVVEADAMTAPWPDLLDGDHWMLVANLPYNIATPLVLDLLDGVAAIDRMLIMVQLEAGERLAAMPGDRTYGIPSVKVAYWATATLVGRVPPTVFYPQPKVESVLVRIVRRPRPATDADPAVLFGLVRRAFGQRRKMLRRSLSGAVSEAAFAAAGVRPEARPEELGVADWGRLADAVGTHPLTPAPSAPQTDGSAAPEPDPDPMDTEGARNPG